MKFTIYLLFLFIIISSCGIAKKSQHNIYTSSINHNIVENYNGLLTESKKDSLLKTLKCGYLTFQNIQDCNRKDKIFDYPNDTIIVFDQYKFDDFAGRDINIISIFNNDQLFYFSDAVANSKIKNQKIDRNFILNNQIYDEGNFKFVNELKKKKFSGIKFKNKPKELNCDVFFISKIINNKVKNIYRKCGNELYDIKIEK